MNLTWKHIAFTLLFGILIGLIFGSEIDCGPRIDVPRVDPWAALRSPTARTIEYVRDTMYQDRITYRDRWHVREVPADVEYDTVRQSTPSPAYIARLDTITPYRDTVRLTFRHPEKTFSLDLSPRPDTVRTFFVTESKTVVIRDNRRWGIGLHAGPGLQMGRDGVVRAGVEVGVGINFNVWEP